MLSRSLKDCHNLFNRDRERGGPRVSSFMNLIQSGASGERLGWVDLDLGSSPGWWAAFVATYCQSRMVEHPKSNSTQPSPKPDAPDCTLQGGTTEFHSGN